MGVKETILGPTSGLFEVEQRLYVTVLVAEDDKFVVLIANFKVKKGHSLRIKQEALTTISRANRRIILNQLSL